MSKIGKPHEPVRKPKSDGFDEMIGQEHRGAKEKTEDVVAEIIRAFNGKNDHELAREVIAYIKDGDAIA